MICNITKQNFVIDVFINSVFTHPFRVLCLTIYKTRLFKILNKLIAENKQSIQNQCYQYNDII